MSMVKNGCGHSGRRALKLAVSQKEITGINFGVLIKIQES